MGNISRDDKSSLALMPCADAASRKYEWENSVSRFCQVKDRFVEPHIDEASNIFPKHPTGPQLGNNAAHFRPQVAFIRKAPSLPSGGEGLIILNFGITRLIPKKTRIPKSNREPLQHKDFCRKTSG